ncbi:hypothetical protein FKM82_020243 [Ascaphus truei]
MLPKTMVITPCSYYLTSLQPLILWTTLFSFIFSLLLVSITKLYLGFLLTSSIIVSVSCLQIPPLPFLVSLWAYLWALSWDLFSFLYVQYL